MAYEKNDSEYAIYTNAVVVEGEVWGGVYNTAEEALDGARAMVAEFEGMTADQIDLYEVNEAFASVQTSQRTN